MLPPTPALLPVKLVDKSTVKNSHYGGATDMSFLDLRVISMMLEDARVWNSTRRIAKLIQFW